jgi:hypothetical protein
MKRWMLFVLVACLCSMPTPAPAKNAPRTHETVSIGVSSQQFGRRSAGATAEIHDRQSQDGAAAHAATSSEGSPAPSGTQAPPYPSISSAAPFFTNATPLGPQSFWYSDGQGHSCAYDPGSSPLCFTVVDGGPARPAVDPAAVAAAVASRLQLGPGEIRRSPAAAGVTGIASWVWLDPPPTTHALSVTLGREAVTVTATPAVRWLFGDGGVSDVGAGVPYRPGPPPADAVTHGYETRCLPGDRGRNPFVLASCGSAGYRLMAVVSWRISYRATGPVSSSGSLPTRTTEVSVSYPVSEVRGFLGGTHA